MVTYVLAASRKRLTGYCAAGDEDQAALLHDAADKLCHLNPWLAKLLEVQATLIVNKQTGQCGDSYNASQDVGRVRMTMSKPAVLVEKLKYILADKGGGKAELRLEWERHVAAVAIALK